MVEKPVVENVVCAYERGDGFKGDEGEQTMNVCVGELLLRVCSGIEGPLYQNLYTYMQEAVM